MSGGAGWGSARRSALLIATDTYDDPDLQLLRSPGRDCAELAVVLADETIGGFHVEQMRDCQAHQVMRTVERFFRDGRPEDLLLLHISCHGLKDLRGKLFFAAQDTERNLPASSAISAEFLREQMEYSRARNIVVLLDCCYSGAFLPGSKGDRDVHVHDALGGRGRVVLTATNRIEYAWEGEFIKEGKLEPSKFTGMLIHGLRTGDADLDRDGYVTITELYEYISRSMRLAGIRQSPQIEAHMEHRGVAVARVVSPRPYAPMGDAVSGAPVEPPQVFGGLTDGALMQEAPPPRKYFAPVSTASAPHLRRQGRVLYSVRTAFLLFPLRSPLGAFLRALAYGFLALQVYVCAAAQGEGGAPFWFSYWTFLIVLLGVLRWLVVLCSPDLQRPVFGRRAEGD